MPTRSTFREVESRGLEPTRVRLIKAGFSKPEDAIAEAEANYDRQCDRLRCPTPKRKRKTKTFEAVIKHPDREEYALLLYDEDRDHGDVEAEKRSQYQDFTESIKADWSRQPVLG